MDQDPVTNTPRSNARRNERDARTLDSPERRRIPPPTFGPVPRLDVSQPAHSLPPFAPGPVQHNDPFQNNYAPAPAVYQHLPAHLAQRLAQLPPLPAASSRGRGRGHSYGHGNNNVFHINQPVVCVL